MQDDGRLNARGARTTGDHAAGKLVAGARVAARLADDPVRANRELLPPIVITGGCRVSLSRVTQLRVRRPLLIAIRAICTASHGSRPLLDDQLMSDERV